MQVEEVKPTNRTLEQAEECNIHFEVVATENKVIVLKDCFFLHNSVV